MRRWLPIIRPPWWIIWLPATPLIALLLIFVAFALTNWRQYEGALAHALLGQQIRVQFCCAFALMYGGFRAIAFHPIFRPDYYQWLANSPWTSRLPLPLGPVHWVWQDLLFIVPATLMAWGEDPRPILAVPIAFAVGYGVPLTASLFLTGERWIAYGVCFLAGWAVHFTARSFINDFNALSINDEPLWATFAVIAACYPLLWWGVRRSLARLQSWECERAAKLFVAFNGLSTASPPPTPLGWPFASLPLRRKDRWRDYGDEIVISLMGGWWLYAAHFSPILLHMLLQVLFTGPFVMAACFWMVCRPPISLWGRLRTGRLFLPRYDRCYFWPFVMCILQWSLASLALDLDVPLPLLTAVQLALFIGCAFRAFRAFEAFQLTGGHRIPLPFTVSTNKQLFTTA